MESKRISICYIALGNNIHTKKFLEFFVNNGHIVSLITPEECYIHDVDIFNINLKKMIPPFNMLRKVKKIRELIKTIKPDILHAHYIHGCGTWAALSGFHPLVLTAWGSDIYQEPKENRIVKALIRYATKKADLVTCDSEDLNEEIKTLQPKTKNIKVVHWGTNLSLFHPHHDTSKLREKLNIDTSVKVVLSTRHFKPLYNIDIVVKSIPIVLKNRKDVVFILKDYRGYSEYRVYIEKLINDLNIQEHVRLVGELPYNELPQYYCLADIFVSLAETDSYPISLQEAMVCGAVPVVGMAPSISELITDGENGFLVPTKDAKSVADTILNIMGNNIKSESIVERNIVLARGKFDHNKYMLEMENLYYSLLQDGKRAITSEK